MKLILPLILVVLCTAISGCAFYGIDKSVTFPDGRNERFHMSGHALFTDKGINEANIEGVGNLKGYRENVNEAAVRAATEGAVVGAGKVIGAAAKVP